MDLPYLGLPLNSAIALMFLNPASLSTSEHRRRVVPVVQTSSIKMTGLCMMLFVGTFSTENSFFDNVCRSFLFFVAWLLLEGSFRRMSWTGRRFAGVAQWSLIFLAIRLLWLKPRSRILDEDVGTGIRIAPSGIHGCRISFASSERCLLMS